MIWRLRGRTRIAELRRHGRRVRRGPVGVIALGTDIMPGETSSPPEVGFAIGRRVGTAVQRNRRRRQLRQIIGCLRRDEPALVPTGRYLVSLAPTDAEFGALQAWTRAAFEALR